MELMDAAQVFSELCLADATFQAINHVLEGHRFIKRFTHCHLPSP